MKGISVYAIGFLILRNGNLLEFAFDKMPVGKHDKDSTPFSQSTVELQQGDLIYTITDGMADQFGGPKGKKFMYRQLKEYLVSVQDCRWKSKKRNW
jgi:serine phosphatase RsbU (regulator of sigma subunit)